MKKVLLIIGICMLAIFQLACTKEDESENNFLTFHNGETINVNVPPALDGLSEIDSVEFYWDKTISQLSTVCHFLIKSNSNRRVKVVIDATLLSIIIRTGATITTIGTINTKLNNV